MLAIMLFNEAKSPLTSDQYLNWHVLDALHSLGVR